MTTSNTPPRTASTSQQATEPGTRQPSPIYEITGDHIVSAMRSALDGHTMSVLPDHHDTGSGIEVASEDIGAIAAFMAALSERSGYVLADLVCGWYTDSDDPASVFAYFPRVLIAERRGHFSDL